MKKTSTFLLSVIALLLSSFLQLQASPKATGEILLSETFDTEEAFNSWTVVDLNDGVTWRWFQNSAAYLLDYLLEQAGNDWLFSPEVNLTAGRTYKLSFLAFVPSTSNYAESFKVTLGSSADPDAHTIVLADYPEFVNKDSETPIELFFDVPSSGTYHLGYYAYSQANQFRFHIDNVLLTEEGSNSTPAAVTNLTITPGAEGALSATVSFTTPDEDRTGGYLDEIEYVYIYRNDETDYIHRIISPSTGSFRSWEDTSPPLGFNKYTVVASNELGAGEETSETAYIGTDIPVGISNALLVREANKLVLTWTAPSEGINNAYVNPEALTYRIIRNDGVIMETDWNSTRYEDASLNLDGDQLKIHYTIYPSSIAGEGEGKETNKVGIGALLLLPFNESFSGGDYENEGWTISQDPYYDDNFWVVDTQCNDPMADPQDGDGGLAYLNGAECYGESFLMFPYMDISSAQYPVLTFWLYHYLNEYSDVTSDYIQVYISADDAEFEAISEKILRRRVEGGWTKYEISLYPYSDTEKIQLAFFGEPKLSYSFAFDNIKIEDITRYDLYASTLIGKKRLSAGEEETYKLRINNQSSISVSDYKVEFFRNGELIETKDGVEIQPEAFYDMEFPISVSLDDVTIGDETHTLLARILYVEDEVSENNETTLEFTVRKPNLPEVTSLTAEQTVDTELKVLLSWEKPEERGASSSEAIVESFEDYEPFIIENIGNWTLADRDGAEPEPFLILGSFPNDSEPMAFQVFNPNEVEIDGYGFLFEPKEGSGSQYAVTRSVYPDTNDDWLISPLLTMESQTVSFIANTAYELFGIERFVFYYSLTDNHPDSFIQLSEGEYEEADRKWKSFSYTLPEGARHFAIRCVSQGGTLLMIDDISFTKAIGDPEAINLLGYNIYRDDEQINTELVTELSFTDDVNAEGTYTYKVTAIYDKGESDYSEEVEVSLIEIIPPVVVSYTPDKDATNVAIATIVSVSFDKTIIANNLNNVTISPDPGNVSASINDNTLVIAHDDFANEMTYTVTIPANSIEHYTEAITWSFTAEKGTYIPQITLDGIVLYPNPAKDMVQLNNLPANSTVTLYNLSGKALKSYNTNGSILKIELNLDSGVYLVKITDREGNSEMKKLIVK